MMVFTALCDGLQDANFNVLGIIAGDAATATAHGLAGAGDLVERYEYTPYGQRQAYIPAGINDPLANTTAGASSTQD